MGIFGPAKEFRERTFTIPCSPREAISLSPRAEDAEGGRPFGVLIDNYLAAQQRGEPVEQPPLAGTVYLVSPGTTD